MATIRGKRCTFANFFGKLEKTKTLKTEQKQKTILL